MFNTMYLKNPDGRPIYGVWHFCKVCGRTYTHSQGCWESIKRSKCCRDNLENVSTEILMQPVCIIENKEAGHVLSKVKFPNQ